MARETTVYRKVFRTERPKRADVTVRVTLEAVGSDFVQFRTRLGNRIIGSVNTTVAQVSRDHRILIGGGF